MLSTSMPIEACEEAVETFGKHVLPKFDKDPVHSTTKQRLAAGGTRKPAGPGRPSARFVPATAEKSPASRRRSISWATWSGVP